MKKLITRFMLIGIVVGALTLSGCGGAAQKAPESSRPSAAQAEKEVAGEAFSSGPYWRIEASDTKNFTYTIPNGNGGVIDMTATLHFIAWFRDKVMARMEERLSSPEQSGGQQPPEADSGDAANQNGLTVDSQGREGMDTNGDGKLEIYFGEDDEVWADFDRDGKYEIAGSEGSSDMDPTDFQK